MMNLDLSGKWALVCGASQGIGASAARALSQQGASVILLSRSQEKLNHTLKDLKDPAKHKALSFDLSDFKNL
ncbi:SDR family NAD(P)-dependent oxidoreductase, partial [bacterium]|nr:SDR family NAD(P)-dependent oxidoreductase [bacterium]